MAIAYLLLGTNLGDKKANLEEALERLDKRLNGSGEPTTPIKSSSFYETEPWGFNSSDWFLNQVLEVETNYLAEELLDICLSVENDMGRDRGSAGSHSETGERVYQSRNIDIDILLFDSEIINSPTLQLPHPRMHQRRFALEPLSELAPNYYHPILKKTIIELLNLVE